MYGHWYSDHSPDKTLKPDVKAFDTPQSVSIPTQSATNMSKTITFNMMNLKSQARSLEIHVGPILNYGAHYSGLGVEEFNYIQRFACPE